MQLFAIGSSFSEIDIYEGKGVCICIRIFLMQNVFLFFDYKNMGRVREKRVKKIRCSQIPCSKTRRMRSPQTVGATARVLRYKPVRYSVNIWLKDSGAVPMRQDEIANAYFYLHSYSEKNDSIKTEISHQHDHILERNATYQCDTAIWD